MDCISSPQVKSVLNVMVIGKWSPCLYLDLWTFSSYSSPTPHPVEEGEWESGWVGVWQPAKVKPTTAGIELCKQLQPCPDCFKHMTNTVEFLVAFIQVRKGVRICTLMIVLDLHHCQIPWVCAQQSSKGVTLCHSQYNILTHKNTCLVCYNCTSILLYATMNLKVFSNLNYSMILWCK